MYLVPPVTAVETWILFGENLGLHAMIGMAVVMLAVALVMSGDGQFFKRHRSS